MERSELLPSQTELLIGNSIEPAHVGTDVRDSEHVELLHITILKSVEEEIAHNDSENSRSQILPRSGVVSEPVTSVVSG